MSVNSDLSIPDLPRKSQRLGLRFPYDWSNPQMSDDALLWHVVERGLFDDVCRVCLHFGVDRVLEVVDRVEQKNGPDVSVRRMLSNIQKGFARAQA